MARSTEGKLAPIVLNAGMNQSGGIHGGIPGSLEYAINCRIRASGRLQRRCGTTAVAAASRGGPGSTGTAAQAYSDSAAIPRPTERPAFALTYEGESYVANTAGNVFAYDGTYHQFRGCCSAMQPMGRTCVIGQSDLTEPILADMPAVGVTAAGYKIIAAATAANEVLRTFISPDGLRLSIAGNGGTIGLGTNYAKVRVVVQGETMIAVYRSGTDIVAVAYVVSNGAIGVFGTATVLALNSADAFWDVTSYDDNNWYIVARTGATTCTVQAVNVLTAGSSGTFSTTGEVELSLWGDSTNGRLWVGYLDDPSGTPTAGFITLDTAFATVYAKTTLLSSAVGVPLFGPRYSRAGANADAFFVMPGATGTSTATRFGHIVSGVVTPTTSSRPAKYWIRPVSKPDAQQRWWAWVRSSEDAPMQFLLLRYYALTTSTTSLTPLIVDASSPINATEFEDYSPGFHAVAVQSELSGGRTFVALPQLLATASAASGRVDSVAIHLYEYARYNQEPTLDVDVANDCIISGQPTALAGADNAFEGVGPVELGFPQQPTITGVVATPDAGGLAAGSYQYQALFQWIDRLGRRHLSAPSTVYDLDLAVASSVAVTISDCQIGQRDSGFQPVTVLLYRTVDGGEIAQLLPMSEPSDGTTGTVVLTDTIADSVVSQNEFIYTGGGVLPNRLAPTCRYVKAAEDRIWLGGLWDENILEASKILIPSEPPNFTLDPSHQVVLPGACTGLAYQDGQIVAFTVDGIYLVGGDGPNDQGAGSFLPPRALIRGLGCTREESASILETEHGIIFRSPSSWWLIPRGFGTPQDIGAMVQDESPHVIAAAVTETTEHRLARFLVGAAGDYSSGTILTLDLTNMQWFRDTYDGGAFGTIGPWPDGLALLQYSLERSGSAVANVIWYEDEDAESDAAATSVYIPYSFRTNWQYPFGPSGWGQVNRVQLAMEPLATATQSLAMTIETDAASYAPTAWSVAGTVAGGPEYREVLTTNGERRCTAFRVTVAITQSSGASTAGFRFLSLVAELGPDGPEMGIRPLLAAHRA
jgi:hypothetical protein